jgi:subtilisin family serine protease
VVKPATSKCLGFFMSDWKKSWQAIVVVAALVLSGLAGYSVSGPTAKDAETTDNDLVILECPTEIRSGALLILDASKSKGVNFNWIVEPATPNFLVIDGGKRAVFSAPGGTYRFYVAGAQGDRIDAEFRTVNVVGGGVTPDPVGPTPEVPKVIEWIKLVPGEKALVKEETQALAKAFRSVQAQIAAGVLRDPNSIIAATAVANRGSLGDRATAWKPFFIELEKSLNAKRDAGELATAEDHQREWSALAKELEYPW